MCRILWGGPLAAALALFSAAPAEAQLCSMPAASCAGPVFQPTIETSFRQEDVITYQDITRVGTRQETVIESVPVTRLGQITVDEGSYQMVWIPRPVTKTIATTTLESRLSQRTVPYAYTQRVPQFATRIVPQQTVRLTAYPTPIVLGAIPATTIVGPSVALQPIVPIISSAPAAGSAAATASTAIPWSTVPSRPHSADSNGGYDGLGVELESPVVPDPLPDPGYDDSVQAPSAARVWQSTQRTLPARW